MNKRLNPSDFVTFFSQVQDYLAGPLGITEGNFPPRWKHHCREMHPGWEELHVVEEQCQPASETGAAAAFSPAIFQEDFRNSWVLLKQIV